jgi:hypothetical protein
LFPIIIVGGSVGGECPRRWLTGTEAATKEAAAAVIMTCFVVVGLWGMLCFWFGGGVNYEVSYSGCEWIIFLLSQTVLWCVDGTCGT